MLKKLVPWTLVLAALMTIFFFATEPGKVSQTRTIKISQTVVKAAEQFTANRSSGSYITARKVNYYIRKSGHFLEYFMLAFCLMTATSLRKPIRGKTIAAVIGFCIICACLDEYYQTLLQDRSGRVKDVVIDTLGATAGVMIYTISRYVLKSPMKAAKIHIKVKD